MAGKPSRLDLNHLEAPLGDDVLRLGEILGRAFAEGRGAAFLQKIEEIRTLAKAACEGEEADWQRVSRPLADMPAEDMVDVARAFVEIA